MTSDVAVRIEGLSKAYKIRHDEQHSTLAEQVLHRVRRPLQRPRVETLWALRDINVEVTRGEVLGLIGRNGAGKSTLLKILSRITPPSEGRVDVHGHVGSLLEVGTGFHPELTGRENIYLNGSILGMKKRDIDRQFVPIVEFAGTERFLDTPVKRYSSGMYVRLAFAVAAHLEPEILIVDEVLAVGDVEFQKKCLGKMGEVAGEGRTVLFVSHNMQAISTLTQRAVLLSGGRCVADGPTEDVIERYLELGAVRERVYEALPLPNEARLTRVEVATSHPDDVHLAGEPLEVRLEISAQTVLNGAAVSIQICDRYGEPIVYLWRFDSDEPLCREPGVYRLTCKIPRLRLFLGHYTLSVHLAEQGTGAKLETIDGICPFEVAMYGTKHYYGWSPGQCRYLEDAGWMVERVAPLEAASVAQAQ